MNEATITGAAHRSDSEQNAARLQDIVDWSDDVLPQLWPLIEPLAPFGLCFVVFQIVRIIMLSDEIGLRRGRAELAALTVGLPLATILRDPIGLLLIAIALAEPAAIPRSPVGFIDFRHTHRRGSAVWPVRLFLHAERLRLSAVVMVAGIACVTVGLKVAGI